MRNAMHSREVKQKDRTNEDTCCSIQPSAERGCMKADGCYSMGALVVKEAIEEDSCCTKRAFNIKAATKETSCSLRTGPKVDGAVKDDRCESQEALVLEGVSKKLSCCSKGSADVERAIEKYSRCSEGAVVERSPPKTYESCSSNRAAVSEVDIKENKCYVSLAAPEMTCCSRDIKSGRCRGQNPVPPNISDFNVARVLESEEVEDEDDATLCDCCIVVVLDGQHPGVGAPLITERVSIEDRLRRCCTIFRSNVTPKKACCFKAEPSQRRQKRVRMRNSEDTEVGQVIRPNLQQARIIGQDEEGSRDKLRLQVNGMDCAECAPNVARALKQLPTVQPVSLDYFGGTADLTYDCEVIQAAAIVRFVSRATGFSIEVLSSSHDTRGADILTLPFSFSGNVPDKISDKYDVIKRKQPRNTFDISFPIQGPDGKLPRDVVADVFEHHGKLVPLAETQRKDNAAIDAQRVGMRCLISIVLCIPTLVFAWANLPGSQNRWTAAALGLCSLLILNAWPLMSPSLRSLIYLRRIDLLFLVTVSITISYVCSVVFFGLQQAGIFVTKPFFETVALLITLIYCGRTVQAYTRLSVATSANAVKKIQSPTVLLTGDDGEKAEKGDRQQELDARLLHYGDQLIMRPDMLFPTDAIVVSGSGGVDESAFTGESVPVIKSEGCLVTAGTRNLDGHFVIQVTHLIHENSLSTMRETIFRAQSSRSKFQDLADRLAAIIFPVAAISAALAFLIWALVERYVREATPSSSGIAGLTYAIAIIVVSCPCALGLAIPLVSSAGMKIGLSEGILFRSGEALHRCRGVTLFAFDKTGTLSKGDFRVREESLHISGARRLAAALTRDNAHPIAKGVAMATSDATSIDLEDKTSIPGNGIEASYQGFSVRGGSASFCGFSDHEAVLKYINAGLSVFVIAIGKRLGAVYGLMDEPRQESAALISEFHRRGMKTAIISGDNDGAVKKFASLIHISSTTTDVWSSCTPESKARIVQDYQSKGNKVCFVGDGVNDSIAFASADVSFSLVSGSEIAIASSDVLLLGPDIRHSIFQALAIARMTYRHSVMALLWCSLYAVTAILLASGILVDFHIEPRWAGLGEVVSVLPVVLIGLSMFLLWSRTSIH